MALTLAMSLHAQLFLVDFEDIVFPTGQNYWNGSDQSEGFSLNGVSFNNSYNPSWMSWTGFAVSSETDVTTAGWTNQYSCYAGSGALNSQKFALWYATGEIHFEQPSNPMSVFITNTTYAALSMKFGDDYAKQFGSSYNAAGEVDGTDGKDWFKLTIIGLDTENEVTGTIDFYLADYRSENPDEHYILDTWAQVDLSSLGTVSKILFELTSTDNGAFGMNTPGYFALDNLTVSNWSGLTNTQKASYMLYPNPASEFLNIRSENAELFEVYIQDVGGQLLSSSLPNNQHYIALGHLPNGVYRVALISENGVVNHRVVLAR